MLLVSVAASQLAEQAAACVVETKLTAETNSLISLRSVNEANVNLWFEVFNENVNDYSDHVAKMMTTMFSVTMLTDMEAFIKVISPREY